MPFIEMRNITKTFPGVVALNNVDFDCEEGLVHGLIGENGAGKSTLIKILNGEYQPDTGSLFVEGVPVQMASPARAARMGISVIHQEFNLINQLSIAKNIYLGREPTKMLGRVDFTRLYRDSAELLGRVGLANLDPETEVSGLSIERKQLVEIAKAISVDARLIVMDEPTAALNGEEVTRLFELIKGLTKEGRGVIFVSHRMEEVFSISDVITVLRDGEVIETRPKTDLNPGVAVRLMTGRDQVSKRLVSPLPPSQPLLQINGLSAPNCFKGLQLTLHTGEIVGLVGLEGQGQREVLRALFGEITSDEGDVLLGGTKVTLKKPKEAIRHGLAFLPEERKEEGLCLGLSVRDNLALPTLESRQTCGFIRSRAEWQVTEETARRLRIVTPTLKRTVSYLSGGNQQKTVLGKWLAANPRILLFSEPTRGIDVGAKEEVYELIIRIASAGTGVIIVSGDLSEVMRMCHRIAVMYEGRIVKVLDGESARKEQILRAMWGLEEESADLVVEPL